MKWAIRGAIGLVGILLIGGFALSFVSLNDFKPQIENAVEEAIGRKLVIAGDLSLGFSLVPTLVATQVTLSNAEGAKGPHMVKAELLRVKFGLLSLLGDRPDIRGVALKDADLWIETNRAGVGNWMFPRNKDTPEPTEVQQLEEIRNPVSDVPPLWMRNVVVHYFDGETQNLTELKLSELNAELRGARIDLSMVGEVNSEAVTFSALMGQEGQLISVEGLKLSYQGLDIAGDVKVRDFTLEAPVRVTGTLEIEALDVDALLDKIGSGQKDVSEKESGALFSSQRLPFDLLKMVDADLVVNIGTLSYQNFELSSLAVPVSLSKGQLDVPLTAAYAGKDLSLNFKARGGAQSGVDVKFDAPEFDLGGFLGEAEITDLVEGRASVGVDLKGRGQSVQEIVGSLTGSMNVVGGRGTIGTKAIELIATDLIWALVPKGGDDDKAHMTCSLTALEFKQGVGRFTALALVTDRMRTSGAGDLDFKKETIDLSLYPSPNDPSLLSLSTTIRVTGAMSNPSIYPDTGALLVEIATAVGAGVFTGGVGAILPLIRLDSFDAKSATACAEVVAKSGHGVGGVTGIVKDVAGDVGDVVGGAVEGVGDIIASPF